MAIDITKMTAADLEHAKRHLPMSDWLKIERAEAKPRKASAAEEEFWKRVDVALFDGIIAGADRQPTPLALEGNTTYRPDFRLVRRDGSLIYVETKGRRMTSESLTRMKLRQCSERYPEHAWWLARWSPRCPWKVQEVVNGVIKRKAIEVPWLL